MSVSTIRLALPLLAAAAGLLAAANALADTSAPALGQHPAVLVKQLPGRLDTNLYAPGHPASPTTRGGAANHEHPAVTLSRQLRDGASQPLDPNTFLVQPPASTHWTVDPAAAPAVALLVR